jgi:hypothetical protein
LAHAPADFQLDQLPLLPYLLYMNFGPPHCWLCARKMAVKVGMFDERLSYRGCEDWDLWLRMAIAGADLATIPHVGALYRRYEGSMSTNINQMLDARAEVLLKASSRLRMQPESNARWGRHLLQAARRVRRRYAAHGIRSPLVATLSTEIRALQTGQADLRSAGQLVREWIGGARWDGLAVSFYRRCRPELFDYYRSSFV